MCGGGRGIRTPERVSPLTVFKTAAFNHSAIPPLSILPDLARPLGLSSTRNPTPKAIAVHYKNNQRSVPEPVPIRASSAGRRLPIRPSGSN